METIKTAQAQLRWKKQNGKRRREEDEDKTAQRIAEGIRRGECGPLIGWRTRAWALLPQTRLRYTCTASSASHAPPPPQRHQSDRQNDREHQSHLDSRSCLCFDFRQLLYVARLFSIVPACLDSVAETRSPWLSICPLNWSRQYGVHSPTTLRIASSTLALVSRWA